MPVAPVKAEVTRSPKTSLLSSCGDSFRTESHCPNQHLSNQPHSPLPTFRAPRTENASWMTMTSLFKVVDPLQHSICGTHTECQTYWTKCVLCHKNIPEELRCPADAKRSIKWVGYKTNAGNLFGFSKTDYLPTIIDVTRLDDGDGVEATFQLNCAKWHAFRRIQFNSTQFVRAGKRKTPCKGLPDVPKKFNRQSVDEKPQPKDTGFFCDEQQYSNDDTLHEESTFELDAHVRKCALQLRLIIERSWCDTHSTGSPGHREYSAYSSEGRNQMALDEWSKSRGDSSPQFKFWSIILQLELEVLICVRSIRGSQLIALCWFLDQDSALVLCTGSH